MVLEDGDLAFKNIPGLVGCEQKVVGGGQAGFQLAEIAIPRDEHGLGGFLSGTSLGADIVGWGEAEIFSVPKCSMIAGVVVGVAAEDIEHEAGEDLPEGFFGGAKLVADDFSEIFVACVAGHHVVEAEERECRHHGFSGPTVFGVFTIKPFDE